MSATIPEELLRQKVEQAVQAALDALIKAHRPAEALAVWLDKPGIFLALVSGFAWQVLEELEPERLEAALQSIERHDPGQSAAMIENQRAVAAWIRSEREMRKCPQWQEMGGNEIPPSEGKGGSKS
jgi:hypothetical protein